MILERGSELVSERFVLRELDAGDATTTYLGWLGEQGSENLYTAGSIGSLADLRTFIADKSSRDDVMFLGIFRRADGAHIGNIKFEPVDTERGFAKVGLLVGDAQSRGQGVASEVLLITAKWLSQNKGIDRIYLSVMPNNAAAVRAYLKTGFEYCETNEIAVVNPAAAKMRLTLC